VIEIDEVNFKKEMIIMYKKGYAEATKDIKDNIISALKSYNTIQGINSMSIDDMTKFIKKINSNIV